MNWVPFFRHRSARLRRTAFYSRMCPGDIWGEVLGCAQGWKGSRKGETGRRVNRAWKCQFRFLVVPELFPKPEASQHTRYRTSHGNQPFQFDPESRKGSRIGSLPPEQELCGPCTSPYSGRRAIPFLPIEISPNVELEQEETNRSAQGLFQFHHATG